jgi:hypothetical protein
MSKDITTLDDAPDVIKAEKPAKVVKASKAIEGGANRVMLNINPSEGEQGRAAVFLQVNGSNIHVPRGKFFEVDEAFVHVLDLATMTVYDPIDGTMHARQVPRYSYTVKPVTAQAE